MVNFSSFSPRFITLFFLSPITHFHPNSRIHLTLSRLEYQLSATTAMGFTPLLFAIFRSSLKWSFLVFPSSLGSHIRTSMGHTSFSSSTHRKFNMPIPRTISCSVPEYCHRTNSIFWLLDLFSTVSSATKTPDVESTWGYGGPHCQYSKTAKLR